MKKTLFALLLFTSFAAFTQEGEVAFKEDGTKVILMPDGTWKVAEESTAEDNEESGELEASCSRYISITVDEMTDKKTIASKSTLVVSPDGGKNGFGILSMRLKEDVVMSIQAVGAGSCIDDDDKINFLFRDGSKLELSNMSDFNCKGRATLYFGKLWRNNSEFEQLQTKQIKTMRVWTSDGYVQEDFSPEESITLMNTLKCLSETEE